MWGSTVHFHVANEIPSPFGCFQFHEVLLWQCIARCFGHCSCKPRSGNIKVFSTAYVAEILLHRRKTEWFVFWQNGNTPLHVAAYNGRQPIVELLLNKGVNAEPVGEVWCFLQYFSDFWYCLFGFDFSARLPFGKLIHHSQVVD